MGLAWRCLGNGFEHSHSFVFGDKELPRKYLGNEFDHTYSLSEGGLAWKYLSNGFERTHSLVSSEGDWLKMHWHGFEHTYSFFRGGIGLEIPWQWIRTHSFTQGGGLAWRYFGNKFDHSHSLIFVGWRGGGGSPL